jgi:hypothetical protein
VLRAFVTFASILVAALPVLFRARREQAVVELAIHQQLAIYAQKKPRPRLTAADRGFWIASVDSGRAGEAHY